jgi:hypothetical protein
MPQQVGATEEVAEVAKDAGDWKQLIGVIKTQAHLNQGLADTVRRLVVQNEEACRAMCETVTTMAAAKQQADAAAAADKAAPSCCFGECQASSSMGDFGGGGGGDHMMHFLLVALLFAWFTVFFRPGGSFRSID